MYFFELRFKFLSCIEFEIFVISIIRFFKVLIFDIMFFSDFYWMFDWVEIYYYKEDICKIFCFFWFIINFIFC